jgi:hypothetical protein
MKSLVLALVGALVILALALVPPVLAQDRGQAGGGGGGGDRGGSGGSGGGGGHAGGGNAGGGGTSSSGSSGGSFSGGGSSGGGFTGGGSSGGGFSGGSISSPNYNGPSPLAGARGGNGGARMGGGAIGRDGIAMMRGGEGRMAVAADPSNSAVPAGARPNYGGPAVGTAVPRGSVTRPTGGNDYTLNYDVWNPWGYYGGGYYNGFFGSRYPYYYGLSYPYGFGAFNNGWYYYPYDPFYLYGYGAFGLGSFYYDPTWFGYGGYGGGGYGGGGYSTGYGSSSDRSTQSSGPRGGLKLKVAPADAEVYVDGYYVGRVDDYNGVFQRLELPVGAHRVELRAKGFQAISFEVTIEPRDTISYHGEMQRAQPIK